MQVITQLTSTWKPKQPVFFMDGNADFQPFFHGNDLVHQLIANHSKIQVDDWGFWRYSLTTLPETNSSRLKMDGWWWLEYDRLLLGPGPVQGPTVSLPECKYHFRHQPASSKWPFDLPKSRIKHPKRSLARTWKSCFHRVSLRFFFWSEASSSKTSIGWSTTSTSDDTQGESKAQQDSQPFFFWQKIPAEKAFYTNKSQQNKEFIPTNPSKTSILAVLGSFWYMVKYTPPK